MFEIGKPYRISVWNGSTITDQYHCVVTKRDGTLITYRQSGGPDVILNTASIGFISATPESGSAG